MIGIYKITSPSEKIYIGQSVDIENRWKFYKTLNCKGQTKLYRSFFKYGVENHKFEIISLCYEEQLNEFERDFQDAYDVIGPNGLNCKLVTSKDKSGRMSEDTKKKISISNSNPSQETRNKIAEASRNRIWTKESKEKLSKSLKDLYENGHVSHLIGRTVSDEVKKLSSLIHKGKILSEETKSKISKNHSKYMLGRKHKKESVDLMNEKKFKKVINILTNEIYESTIECSLKTGYNRNTLIGYLNGRIFNKTNLMYYDNYIKQIIMENKVECPVCLGVGETMEGRKDSKGFEYKECNLCKGEGVVNKEIEEDYLLFLNEDLIDYYE